MIRMKTTVSCFDGATTHPAGICTVPPELAMRLVLRGQGVVVDGEDAPLAPAEAIKVLRLNDDDMKAADPLVRRIFAADSVKAAVAESGAAPVVQDQAGGGS